MSPPRTGFPWKSITTRIGRLLVGLPVLDVIGVDLLLSVPLTVYIETIVAGVEPCSGCGARAWI